MSLTEDDNVPNKHTVRPDPNNMLKVGPDTLYYGP